jgi:transcriptional regulator with XRE-family HTH domain
MDKNKSTPYRETGKHLRKLRNNLSKAEFAEKLGVSLRTYYRYESGERKVPDGLLKLAAIVHQSREHVELLNKELSNNPVITEMDCINLLLIEAMRESGIVLTSYGIDKMGKMIKEHFWKDMKSILMDTFRAYIKVFPEFIKSEPQSSDDPDSQG